MYDPHVIKSLLCLKNESPLKIYYDPSSNMMYFKHSLAEIKSQNVRDLSSKAIAWFDPRPISTTDLEILRSAISRRFGKDIALKAMNIVREGLSIVSNDSSALADHVLEFFVNGEPFAIVYFDLTIKSFDIVPRGLLLSLLLKEGAVGKEYGVIIRNGDHKSLNLVSSNNTLVEFEILDKGFDEGFVEDVMNRPRTTWYDVYKENEMYIEILIDKVRRSVDWLEKTLGKKGFLAISGGKDSVLAACLLVEADSNFTAVYTHIEHGDPEHVASYVEKLSTRLGFELEIIEHKWRYVSSKVEALGMPFRGYRWCTHVFKFYPQMKLAKDLYGFNRIVSYTGSRKYETAKRSAKPATYVDIELGIVSHSVPYKFSRLLEMIVLKYRYRVELLKDYELGFERLSCISCPYKSCFELKLSEKVYSGDFDYWKPFVFRLAREVCPKDPNLALELHLWRLGYQLKDAYLIAKRLGIAYRIPTPTYKAKTFSEDDIKRCIRNTLALFPEASVIKEPSGRTIIDIGKCRAIIERGRALFKFNDDLENCIHFILTIEASLNCIECGICLVKCVKEAISLPLSIDSEKCSRCLACITTCPAALSRLLKHIAKIRGRKEA